MHDPDVGTGTLTLTGSRRRFSAWITTCAELIFRRARSAWNLFTAPSFRKGLGYAAAGVVLLLLGGVFCWRRAPQGR